jgi:hypothetical protein
MRFLIVYVDSHPSTLFYPSHFSTLVHTFLCRRYESPEVALDKATQSLGMVAKTIKAGVDFKGLSKLWAEGAKAQSASRARVRQKLAEEMRKSGSRDREIEEVYRSDGGEEEGDEEEGGGGAAKETTLLLGAAVPGRSLSSKSKLKGEEGVREEK